MRIAYAILSPLLLLSGCATTSMAHGAQDQPMANCPMASGTAAGDQHGAMGDHGPMMGQMSPGQMQGMHHDMANCPMAGSATPAPAPSPAPADPHQH